MYGTYSRLSCPDRVVKKGQFSETFRAGIAKQRAKLNSKQATRVKKKLSLELRTKLCNAARRDARPVLGCSGSASPALSCKCRAAILYILWLQRDIDPYLVVVYTAQVGTCVYVTHSYSIRKVQEPNHLSFPFFYHELIYHAYGSVESIMRFVSIISN